MSAWVIAHSVNFSKLEKLAPRPVCRFFASRFFPFSPSRPFSALNAHIAAHALSGRHRTSHVACSVESAPRYGDDAFCSAPGGVATSVELESR